MFCGVAALSGFLTSAVLQAPAVGIEAWSVILLVFGPATERGSAAATTSIFIDVGLGFRRCQDLSTERRVSPRGGLHGPPGSRGSSRRGVAMVS